MEKRLLICDDDEVVLELCKTIFELRGYLVFTVTSIDNIMKTVETYKPDLILMDIWIPVLGGEVATKILKRNEHTKNIPVIIFSVSPAIDKVTERIGADGYIEKPFEVEALEKEVARYLAESKNPPQSE